MKNKLHLFFGYYFQGRILGTVEAITLRCPSFFRAHFHDKDSENSSNNFTYKL